MPYAYVIVLPTGTTIDTVQETGRHPAPALRRLADLAGRRRPALPQRLRPDRQNPAQGTVLIATDIGTCEGYRCDLTLAPTGASQAMAAPAPQTLPAPRAGTRTRNLVRYPWWRRLAHRAGRDFADGFWRGFWRGFKGRR